MNTIDRTDFFQEAYEQIDYVFRLVSCSSVTVDRSELAAELLTAREYLRAHQMTSAEKVRGSSPLRLVHMFDEFGNDAA